MNPGEYEVMARAEQRHWWYLGLRDLLRRVLTHRRWAPPDNPSVLDAGCGTGENLRFLGQLLDPSYLGGFDASEEAVLLAREKAPDADVYAGDICDPEIRAGSFDLVVSLDVICIPGAARSEEGLRRLVARMAPGGILLLNLPAYAWLHSGHDVAVHTSQRFTAPQLRSLVKRLGLELELVTYRLFFLFPLVLLARLPDLLSPRRRRGAARSDLHSVPGPLANRLLGAVLRFENGLVRAGFRFPWGSSVFAVARKR